MAARSPVFDNVDPRLLGLIQGFKYDPYQTRITSGYRENDPRFHGKGRALDIQLSDPKTGAALANYQDPKTFSAYQQYANALYQHALQNDPELAKQLRWGGYFSGGKGTYGALDLMHFDTAGDVGMGGGGWNEGLSPEQAKIWGLEAGGGIGQGPAMPQQKFDYTPEQRRNAIASIESAGSGDYAAVGPVTDRTGNRAYGRYQIMASNIPSWSKEVLGREVTVDEFLRDPKIQDAIFDKKFGTYVQKYGEEGAAQAWFGGEGNVGKKGTKDMLGTDTGSYGSKYLAALGQAQASGQMPGANDPVVPTPANQMPTGEPGGMAAGAPVAQPKGLAESKALFGNMASAVTGKAGQLPVSTVPRIGGANVTQQTMAPVASMDAQNQLRNQLSMAMQRLNSGKLF